MVIQTAFLGDVILSLYFAQTLKNLLPNSKITFITNPAAKSLCDAVKCIDKVEYYDKRKSQRGLKGIKELADSINNNKTHLLFSLHRSLRSSLLSKYINSEFKIGFSNSVLNKVYNCTADYYFNLHEIERNHQLIKLISSEADISNNITTKINHEAVKYVDDLFAKEKIESSNLILIAPGTVWKTKQWLPDRYKELLMKLQSHNYRTIIIGAKNEKELCQYISKDNSAINLAGESNLEQTLLIMRKSKAIITNDSAPIHLAGIAKLPTIAIFGPTSPIFGFYPRGAKDRIIQNQDLKCRPCLIHGSNTCPIGTTECMTSISADEVFNAIEKL